MAASSSAGLGRIGLWTVLFLVAGAPRFSQAKSPYDLKLGQDVSFLVGGLGFVALSEAFVKPSLAVTPTCKSLLANGRCDPTTLNALDRTVIDNNSHGWALFSDIGATSLYVLPLVLTTLDVMRAGGPDQAREIATDSVVIADSVVAATLVTQAFKFAVRRPRPIEYREVAGQGSVERQMSFPSGHTSSVAAVSAAYATTFALRHPDSPYRFLVAGAATVLTGLVGYGRIGGGWHFYSDVMAGALLGAACGIIVPLARAD